MGKSHGNPKGLPALGWLAVGKRVGNERWPWECALAFLSTPYVLSSLVLSSLVSLPLFTFIFGLFFAVLADKHLLPKSGGILTTTYQVVSIIILEGL